MHALAAAVAPDPDWRLAVVLVVLVVTAAFVSYVGQLGVGHDHVSAAGRAVVQLTVVSLAITATLSSVWWSLAFVLLMYVVATVTSGRRVDVPARQLPWVGLAVAVGAAPVIGLTLASGVIPANGAGIVPMAGILIGGAMTVATLAGRRASSELRGRRGEYEAGLAIGLPQVDAAMLVIQPSARDALAPGLDQTRTVGLVTLPGAFVGVLLGGGTPVQAGAAQILVLVGLMAVQAATAAVLLRLMAQGRVVCADLQGVYPR